MDVHETFWAETETKPRRSKFCPRRDRDETFKIRDETGTRRCSFRDAGRDLEAPETLESLGSFSVLPRRFSVTYGETHWQWRKLYRLINSHHGKRFLYKCTKHQFIHLLTATCYEWHIENSKNHKKVISLTTTSSNCQCAIEKKSK